MKHKLLIDLDKSDINKIDRLVKKIGAGMKRKLWIEAAVKNEVIRTIKNEGTE